MNLMVSVWQVVVQNGFASFELLQLKNNIADMISRKKFLIDFDFNDKNNNPTSLTKFFLYLSKSIPGIVRHEY